VKAPAIQGLLLQKGDRLAICGDSITEQKMYSRIMETYLTACVPELKVTVRQFGWSGETAEGFLRRMTNDCLRFQPTIATICYGMNDHRYGPYDENVAQWYRSNYTAIVRAFKAAKTRVVLGSPGCVGRMPAWVKNAQGSVMDLNLNLCALRNIDIDIAAQENVRFADIFWPMYTAGFAAQNRYSKDYAIAGKDGVHPGWAGATLMARAFLKSLGVDGNIGTFTVDLASGKAEATSGHGVDSFKDGTLTITSRRYPFCATGNPAQDNSIRSAMTLVPFNEELNRLRLVIKGGSATNSTSTWGTESRTYTAEQLARGVNLAEDFVVNPFSDAFAHVEAAVLSKQNYETRQIKELFHGLEGRADMEATAALTETARRRLADAIPPTVVPVTHTLRITAVP
jgi:lysophospholipase L1-like esterase